MLVSHALVIAVTAGVIQDGQQDPIVLQQHDVRPLVWEAPPASGELGLLPLPYPDPTWIREWDAEERTETSAGHLSFLIMQVVEHDLWETNEAEIDKRGSVLWIRAPDSVQLRIEALLRRLRTCLLPEQRLHVRLFSGPGIPTSAPVLDPAEANRLLEPAIQAGGVRLLATGSTTLVDGLVSRIDTGRTRPLTLDWEVEIAHAATVYDPVVRNLDTGLTVQVRAGAVPGGVTLDLAARYCEMTAPPHARVLEVTSYVGTGVPDTSCRDIEVTGDGLRDESLRPLLHRLTIQVPELSFHSFAGSLVIPDGKVLWIPMQGSPAIKRPPVLLELRVEGPARPHLWRLDSADPDRVFADLSKVPDGANVLEIRRPGAWSGSGIHVERPSRWEAVQVEGDTGWRHARIEEPAVARGLREHLDQLEDAYRGAFRHAWLQNHLVMSYPKPLGRRIANDLAALPTVGQPWLLRGTVITANGERGSFSIPVCAGRTASIWGGTEGTYLWDWDVDVAGYALISNPEMRSWFDGYALNLEVLELDGDRFQLRLEGTLNLRRGGPAVLEYDSPITPFVDQLEVDRLSIDEMRAVVLGEEVMLGSERLGLRLRLEPWPESGR